MKISSYLLLCMAVFSTLVSTGMEAAFTIKNGWIADADEVASFSAEEHFQIGMEAMEHADWKEVAKQFRIVTVNFPTTTHAQDSHYYLGLAYYRMQELEFANDAFSQYIKCHQHPQYFQEAVQYKLDIANQFREGALRRFFGSRQLPKWVSGRSYSLDIYDEVIAIVPCHEMAAQSLFAKGQILREDGAYRESIDVFQQLIKRFPRHELALESYLAISRVYVEQSQYELQNPDLLAFSQINLRRFKQDFPREERLAEAEANVQEIKESYAHSLYETGRFYERKDQPHASMIYYRSAIKEFPDTSMARYCEERLSVIGRHLKTCLPQK
jgi:outer membrane protein assembly factor BamD (BamD/ComL family)